MFCVNFIEQSIEQIRQLPSLLALSSKKESLRSLDRESVSCGQKETPGQQKDSKFHGLMLATELKCFSTMTCKTLESTGNWLVYTNVRGLCTDRLFTQESKKADTVN